MEIPTTEAASHPGSDSGLQRAAWLAALFLLYLAVIHWPSPMFGLVRFLTLSRKPPPIGPEPGIIDAAAGCLYVSLPVLLLIAALLASAGTARARVAQTARILAWVAIPIALLDLAFAPFLAGPGSGVVLMIAGSVLGWHVLVAAWATRIRRGLPRLSAGIRLLGAAILALVAWSLTAGLATALSSHQIAQGRPYCVARTEDPLFGLGNFGGYAPLRALEGLRGTRLFTTFTGYKSTSQWWFHAVLIVEGEKGQEYWNWSISRMRFEPFHNPDRFVERPTRSCQPARAFLAKRPWLWL